jgi:asparagine synthase (glutamine-hydrolysing)
LACAQADTPARDVTSKRTAAAETELLSVLRKTVAIHTTADVEIGLNLSGGVDSSLLAALAAECHPDWRVQCFTVADDPDHSDMREATRVGTVVGGCHRALKLSFDEYVDAIPGCVVAEERPSSLSGVASYLLCHHASRHVRVCLDGEGADELFGGYPEYLDRFRRAALLKQRLTVLARAGLPASASVAEIVESASNHECFEDYLAWLFDFNLGQPLIRNHLEILDKYGMSAGLECRVPYLDHHLVEFVSQLPVRFRVEWALGIQKYVLKRAALRAYGAPLWDAVLRMEIGFPAAGRQHLERFDQLCDATLPDAYVDAHKFRDCFSSKRCLVSFDFFVDTFINHRGEPPRGGIIDFMSNVAR